MRCSVSDNECSSGRLRKGLCEKHYRRMLHTGKLEVERIDNLSHYAVAANGCWHWAGARWANGYGKTSIEIHGTRLAHRAFYVEHVGSIVDGLDIDHQCHNRDSDCQRGVTCEHRRCVNPAHLEPVSRQVNLTRAIVSQTVCSRGHDLSIEGAIKLGTAECVQCWRRRYREAGQRYRDKKRTEESQ